MAHRVTVVLTPVPERTAEAVLGPTIDVLSAAEAERLTRLTRPADRVHYGLAHVLARRLLVWTHPWTRAQDWTFDLGDHGRPSPRAPGGVRAGFSLTHTRGLVCCAVGDTLELGVDAETLPALRPVSDSLLRRVLAPKELARVKGAAEGRDRAFLTHWTLKEAYSKAIGLGLHLPFAASEFDVSGPVPTLVRAPGEADPSGWRLVSWQESTGHLLAVAVRPADAEITVAVVPLAEVLDATVGMPAGSASLVDPRL